MMPVLSSTAGTMSGLMTELGSVASTVLDLVGDVASTIVGTPILLMTTGVL